MYHKTTKAIPLFIGERERERDVGLGITSDMCSSAESQCDRTDSHTHH